MSRISAEMAKMMVAGFPLQAVSHLSIGSPGFFTWLVAGFLEAREGKLHGARVFQASAWFTVANVPVC